MIIFEVFTEPKKFNCMEADSVGEMVGADEVYCSLVIFKGQCRGRKGKANEL